MNDEEIAGDSGSPATETASFASAADARRTARRIALAVSVAALGPTLLAMTATIAIGGLSPWLDAGVPLIAVLSTRGQNAAARWMLLGPGSPKGRLLLGVFLIGVDWLAIGVFLRWLSEGADAPFATLGALKILCVLCAIALWAIAALAGERDRIPGIEFPGTRFGIRDLLLGLLLFGLLLAGARVAYPFDTTQFDMAPFADVVFAGCAVAIWSGLTFLIDTGVRQFMLGDERKRGIGVAILFALFVLGSASLTYAGLFVDMLMTAVLIFGAPYLFLLIGLEGILRYWDVRAVNERRGRVSVENYGR